MSVKVTYECSGCYEATETRVLERRFIGVTGRSYGFGHWEYDTPQSVAPEGWQVFDPYTGCCYCPKCWAEIEGEESGLTKEIMDLHDRTMDDLRKA